MHDESDYLQLVPAVDSACELPPPTISLEPCTPAVLREIVYAGENDSDACERLLAQVARMQGALDLAVGDALAALAKGDRLISLGFSCLRDYAREVLGIGARSAQAMVQLSRELRARPQLRAAVLAGEVRIRAAHTVLAVAIGEAEARWVERARKETVRALEAAVREERGEREPEEHWERFRVRLSPEDRATVDEALEVAGKVMPGSSRAQRLEAMAQEYLSEHPVEAGDDGARGVGAAFRPDPARQAREEAKLERESERWSYLSRPDELRAPPPAFDDLSSAEEIHTHLRDLAARRAGWDRLLGYCAYAVRRSGLWRIAGFASFEHYCKERLGLGARTVEQRAAVERRIWQLPTLHKAREAGLSYEKVRLLSRLTDREVRGWLPRARALTCVELRAALAVRDEAQMRAARKLRAFVPESTAEVLRAAFRAVRAWEGRLLADGTCLVRVAREFIDTWKGHAKKARTASQRVRERDLGRCQVPGCSRRAVHAHHVDFRSRGGGDEHENLVALCASHHLWGIHGGYIRVRGRAPDGLVWEVGPPNAPVDLRSRCGVTTCFAGGAAPPAAP